MPRYPSDLNRPLALLAASPLWEAVGHGALVVACSGGPDSVALAIAAAELLRDPLFTARFAKPPRLVLWHLDHGLRTESDSDAQFVEELAQKLRAEALIERMELGTRLQRDGGNMEAEARWERYRRLLELLERNDGWHAVTAHHLDDQAETVLHHILRGTHLAGLRGIAPVFQGLIHRPWLELTKEELVAFLDDRDQAFATDTSNADTRLTRNRLRHEILPLLQQINPRAAQHIASLAEVAREVHDSRDLDLGQLEVQIFPPDQLIRWLPLLGQPSYEVHRLLEGWDASDQLAAYVCHLLGESVPDMHSRDYEQIKQWAAEPVLPLAVRGMLFELPRPQLLCVSAQSAQADVEVRLEFETAIRISDLRISIYADPQEQWELFNQRSRRQAERIRNWPAALGSFCEAPREGPVWEGFFAVVHSPLTLRTWRIGERMRLANGGSSTIGDLFTNAKLPPALRQYWPVLADGNDEAIWLPGIADGISMRMPAGCIPKLLVRIEHAD